MGSDMTAQRCGAGRRRRHAPAGHRDPDGPRADRRTAGRVRAGDVPPVRRLLRRLLADVLPGRRFRRRRRRRPSRHGRRRRFLHQPVAVRGLEAHPSDPRRRARAAAACSPWRTAARSASISARGCSPRRRIGRSKERASSEGRAAMATVKLWSDAEAEADPRVSAVFADIRATRGSDFINNFWRGLANDPGLAGADLVHAQGRHGTGKLGSADQGTGLHRGLDRQWLSRTASTPTRAAARAKGLTAEQHGEFLAVVGHGEPDERAGQRHADPRRSRLQGGG